MKHGYRYLGICATAFQRDFITKYVIDNIYEAFADSSSPLYMKHRFKNEVDEEEESEEEEAEQDSLEVLEVPLAEAPEPEPPAGGGAGKRGKKGKPQPASEIEAGPATPEPTPKKPRVDLASMLSSVRKSFESQS